MEHQGNIRDYAEFSEEKLTHVEALRSSLSIVDHALETLKQNAKNRGVGAGVAVGSTLQRSSTPNNNSSSSVLRQSKHESIKSILMSARETVEQKSMSLTNSSGAFDSLDSKDHSYIIDTKTTEKVMCNMCFAEMEYPKLRNHMKSKCPHRKVECSDCKFLISYCDLANHISKECELAIKRRNLIAQSVARKEEKIRLAKEELTALLEAKIKEKQERVDARAAASLATGAEDTAPEVDELGPPPGPVTAQAVICEQCGESVRFHDLKKHRDENCQCREIWCPNKRLGCPEVCKLRDLSNHLLESCPVEMRKKELIEKSLKRNELIKCPGCGELCMIKDLRKHEQETCVNRRVRCKNHVLGCACWVRLRERELHEKVSGTQAVRYSLQFAGFGAHLPIKENDIHGDWTCEFWMYRPSFEESLRHYLRVFYYAIKEYIYAFLKETIIGLEVKKFTNAIKSGTVIDIGGATAAAENTEKSSSSSTSSATGGAPVSIESMSVADQAKNRVAMVNHLEKLVELYEDTIVAVTYHSQRIGKVISACLYYMDQLKADFKNKPDYFFTELISLFPNICGDLEKVNDEKMKLQASEKEKEEERQKKKALEEMLAFRDLMNKKAADAAAATAKSRPQTTSTTAATAVDDGLVNNENEEVKNEEETDPAVTPEITEIKLEGGDEIGSPIKKGKEKKPKKKEKETEKEKEKYVAVGDETPEQRLFREMKEYFSYGILISLAHASYNYLAPPSYGGSLDPNPNNNINFNADLVSDEFQKLVKVTHNYLIDGKKLNCLRKFFRMKDLKIVKIFETTHFDLVYPERKPEKKVFDNRELVEDVRFSFNEWADILVTLKEIINIDLNVNVARRLSAGLLEEFKVPFGRIMKNYKDQEKFPYYSGGEDRVKIKKEKELTEEEERAKAKKEKAKAKRDLKKLKEKQEKEEKEALAIAGIDGGGKKKKIKVKKVVEKMKLSMRLLRLIRGNVGLETLMVSSEMNAEGFKHRLCLETFTGMVFDSLNVMLTNKELNVTDKKFIVASEHDNQLLKKLQKTANQLPTNSDSNKISYFEGGNIGYFTPNYSNTSICGGVFPVSVPRCQWVHVAVVGSYTPFVKEMIIEKKPDKKGRGKGEGVEEEVVQKKKNRVTLYIDGQMKGYVKDVCGPMAMGSIGGIDTLSSFTGILLDARYWAKQRSGAEIYRSKHILIDINELLMYGPGGKPQPGAKKLRRFLAKKTKKVKEEKEMPALENGATTPADESKAAASSEETKSTADNVIALTSSAVDENNTNNNNNDSNNSNSNRIVEEAKDGAGIFNKKSKEIEEDADGDDEDDDENDGNDDEEGGGGDNLTEEAAAAATDDAKGGAAKKAASTKKSKRGGGNNKRKEISGPDLSSKCLMAWWTFEDGLIVDERFGGGTTISYNVTDVTEQRFKAPIIRYLQHKFNMKRMSAAANSSAEVGGGEGGGGDEGVDDEKLLLSPGQINASNNTFDTLPEDYLFPPLMDSVDRSLEEIFDKLFFSSLFPWENILYVNKQVKIMFEKWVKPPEKTEEELKAEEAKALENFKTDAELELEKLAVTLKDGAYDICKRGFNWNNAEMLYRKPVASKDSGLKKKESSNKDKEESKDPREKDKKKQEKEIVDEDNLLPLPSFRMRNICAFEIRKHRLMMRGKSLQREVECPLKCMMRIKLLEVRFHIRFECTKRRVPCRFEFCKALFPISERDNHEKNFCYNSVKRKAILAQAEESHAEENCDQCGLSIRVKEMESHLKVDCAHRLVDCGYADCSIKFQAHLLDYHFKYECESQKIAKRYFLIARARERSQYQRSWCVEIPFYSSKEAPIDDSDEDEEEKKDAAVATAQSDSDDGEDERHLTIEQRINEKVHREFAASKQWATKSKTAAHKIDDSDDDSISSI